MVLCWHERRVKGHEKRFGRPNCGTGNPTFVDVFLAGKKQNVHCNSILRENYGKKITHHYHHQNQVISAIFLKDTLDAANNDAEQAVVERLQKKKQYAA